MVVLTNQIGISLECNGDIAEYDAYYQQFDVDFVQKWSVVFPVNLQYQWGYVCVCEPVRKKHENIGKVIESHGE